MIKQNFVPKLKAFSFALLAGAALAALALFASCSNLGASIARDGGAVVGTEGQQSGQGGTSGVAGPDAVAVGTGGTDSGADGGAGGTLTASVALQGLQTPVSSSGAGMTDEPSNADGGQAEDIPKSAFPELPDVSDTSYFFTATLESGGGASYSASGVYNSSTSKYDFDFIGAVKLTAQTYTLTVTLSHSGGAGTTEVAGASKEVTVPAAAISFEASVRLNPKTGAGLSGSVSLPIKFDDTNIKSVDVQLMDSSGADKASAYLSATSFAVDSAGKTTITSRATDSVPAGVYKLLMAFKNSGGAALGAREETLNVFASMQTKFWWTGAGTVLTLQISDTDTQTEYWVRGTGGSFYSQSFASGWTAADTNQGIFAAPLETLQAAVDKIEAAGDTTAQYTIYVDGTVSAGASPVFKGSADQYKALAYISGAKKIKITGWSGSDKDIIDCNSKCRGITTANASAKVEMEKLSITNGGNVSNGGAIYVKNGSLAMNSGTISSNTATSSGGGVAVENGGTFIMSGGKISGNSAGLNGGGINNSGIACIYGDAVIGDDGASGTATSETDCSNKAGYNGGGICNEGKLAFGYKAWASSDDAPAASDAQTLNKGVYYNYADNGGGIFNSNSGTACIASGNVSMNKAASESDGGGGICNYGAGAMLYLSGGMIGGNSAMCGGGIYNKGVALVYGSAKIGDSGKANKAEKSTAGGTVVGGGIYNASTGKLGLGYSAWTGATLTAASWTGSVSYNTARDGGGGVCNAGAGAGIVMMQMSDGGIYNNSAPIGGGLYTATSVNMSGGTISYNEATTGGGGGVFAAGGTFTIDGGAIASNTAKTFGGGLDMVNASLSMSSGAITLNQANMGAGVYLDNGDGTAGAAIYTSTLSGGTISKNTGTAASGERSFGGGVFIGKNTKLDVSGGLVERNTADCGGAVYISLVEDADDPTSFVFGFLDLSADASLPGGSDNKNDIQISNSITVSAALSNANVATISSVYDDSGMYIAGTQVLEGAGASALPAGSNAKFTVKPDASTKTWGIDENGILVEQTVGGGSITIHTPEGDLNLTASAATIDTSASDTTVTVSATDSSGAAITSGLTWNGVTVYYGADEIDSGSGNSYKFKKTFPKGTYTLNVSVTYNGTTYSDSFTIKKTVEGAE